MIPTMADTTSQAEAQVSTTAASVLTKIANWKAYIHHEDRIHTTLWLATQLQRAEGFIDRLTSTVGAPAPAPTMPTRDEIRKVLERDVSSADETANAILALIAKGDTP